ncbi:MAG: hypothetical protein JWP81_1155 [Ferruginibacter sp.]|nr:hypothetical protein [Ferruginibacter sp.]
MKTAEGSFPMETAYTFEASGKDVTIMGLAIGVYLPAFKTFYIIHEFYDETGQLQRSKNHQIYPGKKR